MAFCTMKGVMASFLHQQLINSRYHLMNGTIFTGKSDDTIATLFAVIIVGLIVMY